ncbi:hypothetical protein V8E53_006110, partial [Lactarius tabidus]
MHSPESPNRLAQPTLPRPISTTTSELECPQARTGMIGELSDDVLLKIFCYYLDTSPRCWPMLVHICRRWRHIIFASQHVLHLRLFCTYRTPVMKTLDCWPALPIVIEYGGALELDLLASEDEANIMVALKRSDRVHSIRLNLTNPLLEKLSAIKTTFSQLEDLVLQARDNLPLPLPDSLSWGRRIRSLELTRVTFSALPQLLYSSRELVHLHLHEVLYPSHSSPQVLIDALYRTARLRSLSLRLPPITNPITASSLPWRRNFLHALARVNFIGIAEYLEDFVAMLHAPRLEDIEIALFNESIPRLSNLIKFIDRIGMHKLHRRAEIIFSQNTLSISFTQPGAPTRFRLQLHCRALDTQLMTMIAILYQFRIFASKFLDNVKDLRIAVTQESSQDDLWMTELSRQGYLHRSAAVPSLPEYLRPRVALQSIEDDSCWLELIDSFEGAEQFHVAGNYSTKIVGALVRQDWWKGCLDKLYIRQPGPQHAPLRSAVVTLMTSRRLSGHPIEVEYECLINEGLSE